MTGGAGGDTNAGLVQIHENVLPVNVFKRDVRRVWQTLRTIRDAVEARVWNVCEDLVFETVAQMLDAIVIVVVECKLASGAETSNVWNGGCASAASLLLSTADNERRQRQTFANVKRADALRRVQLVT